MSGKMELERVVHAKYNGVEVARYDDEWFLEATHARPKRMYYDVVPEKEDRLSGKKEKVSLKKAALSAAEGVKEAWLPSMRAWPSGFQVFFRQEGGAEFDEIVRKVCPFLYIEIEYIDLSDDHKFMAMKCPGCQEWIQINDRQLGGLDCIDHSRISGGCGFHGYTIGKHAGYIVDLGDVLNKRVQKS